MSFMGTKWVDSISNLLRRDSTGNDNDKRQRVSSFHNQKEDSFQENPRLESPDEEKLNGKGTSGSPDINTAVHPTSIPSLDIKCM